MCKRIRILLSGEENIDNEALELLKCLSTDIEIEKSYDAIAIFPRTGKPLPAVRTDEGDRYYGINDLKLLIERELKGRELAKA
jgi:hypothetical protein